MDKLSYKNLLTEEMSKVSELENEINRLQMLVAKYKDKQIKLTKIVYDNPNNMSLGKIVRSMFPESNE